MDKRLLSGSYIENDKFLNALAEAFRLQETILNATDIPIFSVSSEGLINSFNRASETLLGYEANAVIGKTSPLVFHDLDEVIRRSQQLSEELGHKIEPLFDLLTIKARAQHTADRQEWTLIRKDGSRFQAMLSISALRDEQGAVTGYIVIPADITETKRIREQAKASEEKFRVLAENIPGAIYLSEHESPYQTIFVNDHIQVMTGYPAKDFLSGKVNISQLIHPEDAKLINGEVKKAIDAGTRFHLQYRMQHRSGEWRWIDEVGVGIYQDGKVTMLEGYLTDITAQKSSEEELRRIAAENFQVFNSAVTLNVIAGMDGYFRRASQSWTNITGWTEEELKTKRYIDFVHPADRASTREVLQYIRDGNNLFTFENRYRCKDGSYRWLLWGSSPDIHSQVIYASAIDITERKKSEEKLLNSKKNLETIAVKLQAQNKQLDEFAHIISHNLRAPVGNIQALINLLDEKSTIEDYQLIFDKLKNVAKNLGDTMNDLMDTLKAKTQADVERTEIRFKEILDKVVQSLEGELIVAEASITFDFNAAPSVQYSRAYLESIFQNLLTNALKYRSAERKAVIHFQTNTVNGAIELRVSDNGQGIDMEKFGDKLFGLHRTFHTHDQARGVGLFLIKTQIESMGGSIIAESEVGKGTTFIIRFGS